MLCLAGVLAARAHRAAAAPWRPSHARRAAPHPPDGVSGVVSLRGAAAGPVATPLNYRYMAPEIDHALAVSGACALLAHAEREEDLAASRLASQLPLGTISYGGTPGAARAFGQLMEGEASSSPPPPSPA